MWNPSDFTTATELLKPHDCCLLSAFLNCVSGIHLKQTWVPSGIWWTQPGACLYCISLLSVWIKHCYSRMGVSLGIEHRHNFQILEQSRKTDYLETLSKSLILIQFSHMWSFSHILSNLDEHSNLPSILKSLPSHTLNALCLLFLFLSFFLFFRYLFWRKGFFWLEK